MSKGDTDVLNLGTDAAFHTGMLTMLKPKIGKTGSKSWKRILCVLIAILSLSGMARAQQCMLGWDACSDSSVTGYAVYYGAQSGNYTTRIDAGTNLMVTVSNLSVGSNYYFVVVSYDQSGNESAPSAEISTLVTNPGFLRLAMSSGPNPCPLITFTMLTGHYYILQASSDLRTWTPIWSTSTATSNQLITFKDITMGSTLNTQRFYRTVQQ